MSDIETREEAVSASSTPEINEELDQLLNNGVSRSTPFYDLINIDRAC